MLFALTSRSPLANLPSALLASVLVGCSGGAAAPPRDPAPASEASSPDLESAPREPQPEAVRCELDGPPMVGSFDGAIGPLGQGVDGTIILVDHRRQLRRYRPVSRGAACTLTLDRSYGVDGIKDSGITLQEAFEGFQTDARGRVFLVAGGRLTRLADGEDDYVCPELHGGLAVAPSGEWGLMFTPIIGGAVRLVRFGRSGCEASGWGTRDVPPRVEAVSFLDEDTLFIAGRASFRGTVRGRSYTSEGAPLGTDFGDPRASHSVPEHLCAGGIGPAFRAGTHVAILDLTCGRLRLYEPATGSVRALDLYRLFGGLQLVPKGITYVGDEVYVSVVLIRRGTPEAYEGHVFRISGLSQLEPRGAAAL